MVYNGKLLGNALRVSIAGEFTISDYKSFKPFIFLPDEQTNLDKIIFDLSRLSFMNSSGIGMLLLAFEAAHKNDIKVILENPTKEVKKMLHLCRFDRYISNI